jgi:hypothetical protein
MTLLDTSPSFHLYQKAAHGDGNKSTVVEALDQGEQCDDDLAFAWLLCFLVDGRLVCGATILHIIMTIHLSRNATRRSAHP